MTDEEICKHFFANYRSQAYRGNGLRLNGHGFYILRSAFKHWTVELPEDLYIKGRHLLYLDKTLKSCWHMQRGKIHCFDPNDAFTIKLVSGDLDALADIEDKKKA